LASKFSNNVLFNDQKLENGIIRNLTCFVLHDSARTSESFSLEFIWMLSVSAGRPIISDDAVVVHVPAKKSADSVIDLKTNYIPIIGFL
jgi:hypothetical protein